jgi:hypothetical protein
LGYLKSQSSHLDVMILFHQRFPLFKHIDNSTNFLGPQLCGPEASIFVLCCGFVRVEAPTFPVILFLSHCPFASTLGALCTPTLEDYGSLTVLCRPFGA